MLIDAAPGSVKLDVISSIDLQVQPAAWTFAAKMRSDVVTLLEGLESWVDRVSISMEAAQHPEKLSASFDALLKVMEALYQVKQRRAAQDLLIEQLRETLCALAADKVATAKLDKRLDEAAHKWDEVKKRSAQVKADVEPIQVGISTR